MTRARGKRSRGCIALTLKMRLAETRPSGRAHRRTQAPSLTVGFPPHGGDQLTRQVDVFKLTRELIDIPSVTGGEFEVGNSLGELLSRLGYQVELQEVADDRANVIATTGTPARVVLSTHMDTVPPHVTSSEDEEFIYGRGA